MTAFRQTIRRLHRELGIPEDFEVNCKIPLQDEATALVSVGRDMFDREQYLTPAACAAWKAMQAAASEDGVELVIVSAFRSVAYQCHLIHGKLDRGQAIDDILKVNAAPGFSEHHTGRALDLNTPGCEPLTEAFEETEAFDWLSRKAPGFDFSLSYPRDNPFDIVYEPWHWAYKA